MVYVVVTIPLGLVAAWLLDTLGLRTSVSAHCCFVVVFGGGGGGGGICECASFSLCGQKLVHSPCILEWH